MEPGSREYAIAQHIIKYSKPKNIVCNNDSVVEYWVALGVLHGIMLAMSELRMFTGRKEWQCS